MKLNAVPRKPPSVEWIGGTVHCALNCGSQKAKSNWLRLCCDADRSIVVCVFARTSSVCVVLSSESMDNVAIKRGGGGPGDGGGDGGGLYRAIGPQSAQSACIIPNPVVSVCQ